MRTTLTLDKDVAIRLERLRRSREGNYRRLVNEILRAGLAAAESPSTGRRQPYRIQPVSLGARLPNVDDVAEIVAAAESETAG